MAGTLMLGIGDVPQPIRFWVSIMMTEERFEWLGLLSRKIAETDRLIEQERNSDVIDVPYLRDLKARAAELRTEAQRLCNWHSNVKGRASS
jgi:hypothetical protein